VTQPEPQVTVYLTNAVRTSQGPGPKTPASEAGALVGMKYAVYGDRPPNEPNPEPTTQRFGSPPPPPSDPWVGDDPLGR
jgi:hypothetical protein